MKTFEKLVAVVLTVTAGSLLYVTLAAAALIEVKSKDGLGSYLTDDKGMTLYLFTKDAPGKSVCGAANGCTERWPLFYVDKVDFNPDLDATAFGTITRDDGKKQTTYKGKPLYYFFKDKVPGDTSGQGVNNVWYVVAP